MDVLADRYELGEPLGSGGMSRVIAAHDRVLGRRVAVKLLRDDLAEDPTVRERLLREARAAASFAHPNAVAVFDVGERTNGQPFIVMELIEGCTLGQELGERGSLPVEEALGIADGVLAALQAAHARGLVHRDVKPGNILLTAERHAKLADFGIAKGLQAAAGHLTGTGEVIGTPRYLAPERAAGGPADARSDLYSLGVVLYEMLAGRPPFSADNPVALALAHQREPAPPLIERRPDVPAWLAAAIERALEKDPSRRFSSADEFRAALRNHPGDERFAMPHADTGATTALVGEAGLTQATTAGLRTAPLSSEERSAPSRAVQHRRPPRWPVVALVAALLLVAVLLLQNEPPAEPSGDQAEAEVDGGAGDEPAVPGEAADEPIDAAGEDPAGAGEETGQPGAARVSLEVVLDELRQNPEAYGDRADNLEGHLENVLDEEGAKLNREARRLMTDIEKWMDEGRLHPELGDNVIGLLEELLR